MEHNNTFRLLINVIGGGISLITLNFFVCLLLSCGEDTTIQPPSPNLDTRTQASDSTAADSTAADSTAVTTTTIVVDTTWAEVMEYNYDGTPAADTLNINLPTDGDISEGNPDDAA